MYQDDRQFMDLWKKIDKSFDNQRTYQLAT